MTGSHGAMLGDGRAGIAQSPNRNMAWARALVDELARCGVRDAVVSPGSRSAPLALALAEQPDIADRVWLDERGAGYFALGLARMRRAPVIVACTSGTAAANLLPAVVEARHSRLPLIVLSADRPPELRDCGAAQTIDQIKLYGAHARFFAEAPLPELHDAAFVQLRSLACRAVAEARGEPAGPVHLDVPLREPLEPSEDGGDRRELARLSTLASDGRGSRPFVQVEPRPGPRPTPALLERLAAWLREEPRGLVVAGPLDLDSDGARVVARLAQASGWPVLAEPLSQLRCSTELGDALVDAHDAVLRAPAFVDAWLPRRVLRLGALPTSKPIRLLLEAHPEIEQWIVDPCDWREPTALGDRMLRVDPVALARDLLPALRPVAVELRDDARRARFRVRWTAAGERARRALDAELAAAAGLSEPGVVYTLARHLAPGTTLFTASSMPVRDVDTFWPADPSCEPPRAVVANRGANGIDGTLSSALGTAAGCDGPCVALIGDLALLHDWTALLAAREADLDLTVVVLDNDGGGIFEFLPVAESLPRAQFERQFGTPPGIDLLAALHGFGVDARRVTEPSALAQALAGSLGTAGVRFLVVPGDRRENRELHRKLYGRVAAALAPHADTAQTEPAEDDA